MFELDKYANTVLTAYAVSMLLLGVLIWLTLSKSKKIKEGFYFEIKELVKKIPGNPQILNHLIDKIYARDY